MPASRKSSQRSSGSVRYRAPVAMMTARPETVAPSAEDQLERLTAGAQFGDGAGSRDRRAELVSLDQRASGQVGPGQPGREAEIVLDPGTRSRLAADGNPVEQDGVQALGCPVHGGGQSGRAGPDDHQVEDRTGRCGERQPEVLGDDARRGVAQDRRRGDHDRQVGDARVDRPGQGLPLRLLEVQPQVRHTLARGPVSQRVGTGGEPAAEDLQAAGAIVAEQPFAPHHERAQDEIGQRGLGRHQVPERRRREPVHEPVGVHARGEEDGLAVEHAQLADEPPRTHAHDDALRRVGGGFPDDVDLAALDQDEVVDEVADAEQGIAGGHLLRCRQLD